MLLFIFCQNSWSTLSNVVLLDITIGFGSRTQQLWSSFGSLWERSGTKAQKGMPLFFSNIWFQRNVWKNMVNSEGILTSLVISGHCSMHTLIRSSWSASPLNYAPSKIANISAKKYMCFFFKIWKCVCALSLWSSGTLKFHVPSIGNGQWLHLA